MSCLYCLNIKQSTSLQNILPIGINKFIFLFMSYTEFSFSNESLFIVRFQSPCDQIKSYLVHTTVYRIIFRKKNDYTIILINTLGN